MRKVLNRVVLLMLVFFICAATVFYFADNRKPIMILAAEETEFHLLREKIEDAHIGHDSIYEYIKGKVDGYPVVAVKIHMGIENALLSTSYAIRKFNPLCVFMEGTSGGHNPDLKLGDIVLGKEVKNLDSYKTARLGKGKKSDITGWDFGGIYFFTTTDKFERKTSFFADETLLRIAETVKNDHGNVYSGIHGTSNAWNREYDRISFFNKTLKTDVEEMEDFAIAFVCSYARIPFLAIRVVSNSEMLPDAADDEYAFFGIYSQEFALKVVKKLVEEIKANRISL